MEDANSTTLCIKMRNVNSHSSPLPPPSNCPRNTSSFSTNNRFFQFGFLPSSHLQDSWVLIYSSEAIGLVSIEVESSCCHAAHGHTVSLLKSGTNCNWSMLPRCQGSGHTWVRRKHKGHAQGLMVTRPGPRTQRLSDRKDEIDQRVIRASFKSQLVTPVMTWLSSRFLLAVDGPCVPLSRKGPLSSEHSPSCHLPHECGMGAGERKSGLMKEKGAAPHLRALSRTVLGKPIH